MFGLRSLAEPISRLAAEQSIKGRLI